MRRSNPPSHRRFCKSEATSRRDSNGDLETLWGPLKDKKSRQAESFTIGQTRKGTTGKKKSPWARILSQKGGPPTASLPQVLLCVVRGKTWGVNPRDGQWLRNTNLGDPAHVIRLENRKYGLPAPHLRGAPAAPQRADEGGPILKARGGGAP